MGIATQTLCIAQTWDGLPIAKDETARVSLAREDRDLVIEVEAPFHGDPAPPGSPASTPGLWEYEVIELFVASGEIGREPLLYTEIELSPYGHFLVLRLKGLRQVVASGLPLRFEATIEDQRWRGRACLSLEHLPSSSKGVSLQGNAFAIHGQGDRRRYLVHSSLREELRGSAPDFHRPEAFVPLCV